MSNMHWNYDAIRKRRDEIRQSERLLSDATLEGALALLVANNPLYEDMLPLYEDMLEFERAAEANLLAANGDELVAYDKIGCMS